MVEKDTKPGTASKNFGEACSKINLSPKELAAGLIAVGAHVGLPVMTVGLSTGNPVLVGAGAVTYVGGAATAIALDHMRTVDEKQMDLLAAARFTDCNFTDTYRSVHGTTAAVSVLEAARDPQTFNIVRQEIAMTPDQQKYLAEFSIMEKDRLKALAPVSSPDPTNASNTGGSRPALGLKNS